MEVVAAKSLSNEEVVHAFWRGGNLKFLMHDGQRAFRQQFHGWRMVDQSSDTELIAGSMPRVFCMAKSGRWGGTTLMVWMLYELQVWFAERYKRPMFLRFTSAWQKSIDEIIGAVVPQCFETAPPECRPQYFGKRGTRPAGLYFPVYGPCNGGSIALAGLDMNPDATRGQASDGDVISEAAFVNRLDYVLRSVLYRQYQGRPWARAVLESSAPKDKHTDWERIYVPDAKRRGAYFSATIEDNPRLSRKEKDEFISAAGGRGDPNCEREYFNVISGDPQKRTFPEFDREKFVRDMPRPTHAYALGWFDPGFRHLFGAAWAYYDFERAIIVVQDSWAGSNASTAKVACITAAREYDLYGTLPPRQLAFIPLEADGTRLGWRDYLRKDRCESLADDLHELATMPEQERPDYEHRPGKFVRFDRPNHWTYYDNVSRHEFMPNPETRVADVDLKLIADMRETFGFDFQSTTKETLRGMVNHARSWLSQGRVVFLPEAGPIIDHVDAANWADDHKKLDEHPVYGHFDLAACISEGSLIKTDRGDVPIEQVRVGDRVQTRAGLRLVTDAWLVGERDVWKLEAGGHSLVATADHKIWTTSGWKMLASLTASDTLCTWESLDVEKPSSSTAGHTVAIQTVTCASIEITTVLGRVIRFIEMCGSFITETFLRAWTFITSMRTHSTTISQICNSSTTASTGANTWVRRSWPSYAKTWPRLLQRLRSGIVQRLAEIGIVRTARGVAESLSRSALSAPALCAEPSSNRPCLPLCFVPIRAFTSRGTPRLTESRPPASSAGNSSSGWPPDISGRRSPALRSAVPSGVGPTKTRMRVYDLSVEGQHEFFASGILVHNCFTYGCRYMSLIENLNPMPPVGVIESRDRPGAVVERMPWQQPHPYELEVDRRIEAFEAELAAERGRMRDPVRMRPFK